MTNDEIAELSLQFMRMEPLSDFDYIGFARAIMAIERETCAKVCDSEAVTLATRDQTRGALYVAGKLRVGALPPQHPGQARTMLICETESTISAEVGHWYSPDKVEELIARSVDVLGNGGGDGQ